MLPMTFSPAGRSAALAVAALVPSLLAAQTRPARGGATASADSTRIRADIAYLADDKLEGRLTGTPGNDSAAAYIARRFRALGLAPIVQPFTARIPAGHAVAPRPLPTTNVGALIRGRDPALRGQVVVIGAHYDHLGRDATFANDRGAGDAIRNGADDNASGTAAVLELARLISARPLRRSVLVVAFSGEEEGTLGSQYFVDNPPVPVDSMVAMLNFDMVGRLSNDKLLVYGVGTATELPAIVDTANAAGARLTLKTLPDGVGPSDHAPFYLKNLPVLHFFTDVHGDYHAATDDIDKIDAGGEARVVNLGHAIARTIGDRPARLTFTRTASTQRMATGDPSAGPRPYFGSVPDMGSDATGMRLSGVTPGSPADKGGVKAGDIVVEFGGKAITDLYTYTDALNAQKPGDAVTVVVKRGPAGERVTLSVTLGKRGE